MQAKMVKEDPCNHTRWKHKWRWRSRGNVWDKVATDWAGKEGWRSERKKRGALADKTKFVTFAVNTVKRPTVHMEKGEGKENEVNEKTPRDLEPADTTIHTWKRGRQYSNVETVRWQVSGSTDNILWLQKYRGRIGQVHKALYSRWRRKIANPISKIDDFVKHVLGKHNREADLLANMGAEGQ